jgi:hypothetical protein
MENLVNTIELKENLANTIEVKKDLSYSLDATIGTKL